MKIAVAVQRYGADINGGAELHARYIAERLARHADVEVVTTCARDYVTWRNERPAGQETVNGIAVRRFAVAARTDAARLRRSRFAFVSGSEVEGLRWFGIPGAAVGLVDGRLPFAASRSFDRS